MRPEMLAAVMLAAAPDVFGGLVDRTDEPATFTLTKPPEGNVYRNRRAYIGDLPYTPTTEQQRSDAILESRRKRHANFARKQS